jgi:hypothetical protein
MKNEKMKDAFLHFMNERTNKGPLLLFLSCPLTPFLALGIFAFWGLFGNLGGSDGA